MRIFASTTSLWVMHAYIERDLLPVEGATRAGQRYCRGNAWDRFALASLEKIALKRASQVVVTLNPQEYKLLGRESRRAWSSAGEGFEYSLVLSVFRGMRVCNLGGRPRSESAASSSVRWMP